jgi:drug/metabolite transporter (DMT)-like permease
MFVAYAVLIILSVIWGTTFPLVQGALSYASPMVFLALRFGIAAVVFALIVWPRAHKWDGNVLWKGMALGLLLWLGFALQTVGLKYTTAARSGFLTGTFVPLTPVFAWLLFRHKIRLRLWMAVLLAFGGVAIMSQPNAGGLNWGDGLTLLCGVSFALQVVLVDRWSKSENLIPLTWLQFVMAMLLSTTFMRWETPHVEWTPFLVIALAVTSLLASVFAIWGQMHFQPRISPAAAAVIYSCEPVFAGISSWIIVGTIPPQAALIGAGFIVAGMLLSAAPSSSKPVTP